MLEKQQNKEPHLQVERAIDELRRQQGVVISEPGGHEVGNLPAEFLDAATFAALQPHSTHLLITAARARSLGLPASDTRIETRGLTLAQLHSISDPTAPQATLPQLETTGASFIDSMALKLAKYASLLPALLLVQNAPLTHWLRVEAADIEDYIANPQLEIFETAHAQLPLETAENTRLLCFRTRHSMSSHLALLVGEPEKDASPLVRVHSSCVTGDLLGSLRCDCGDQLHMALRQISEAGSGILIYLHQEGRGIGIANKLRAYRLQEQGMDTYDANLMLGYEEDERDFSVAAAILRHLNIGPVTLLTNNPHKRSALEKAGVAVKERISLSAPVGTHNHAYLDAKAKNPATCFNHFHMADLQKSAMIPASAKQEAI